MEGNMGQCVPYDVIILGASGFSGKYVLREALNFLNSPSSPLQTLALAGRNPTKIREALHWAAHPNSPPPIPILTADTSNPPSIRHLCSQTKLILSCIGPFHLHGEAVVATCVETGCDYLDISAELVFMERMEEKYHKKAMESGSLVISACGFDSVPVELGWMFNARQWVGPSAPNQIQIYVNFESRKKVVFSYGSFESVVCQVANMEEFLELQELRRSRPMPVIPGPLPAQASIVEHKKELGHWAASFPGIFERSQSSMTKYPKGIAGINESDEEIKKREAFWSTVKPAHFGAPMICCKNLIHALKYIGCGILVGVIGRIAIGRWVMLKNPSVFSLGWFRNPGPTEEEARSCTMKMWFIGRGYSDVNKVSKPDMEIVTRITGGEADGYVVSAKMIVQCALTLLAQRNTLPKGGVYPPGIVFGPTHLQQRLQQNGFSFDFVSKRSLAPP